MKDKKSIDNMKKFVEEEFFRDIDKLDEEVKKNMALHPCEFPEELDLMLKARIKEIDENRKVYDLLSEEDKEALRIGREAIIMRELEEDTEEYEDEDDSEVVLTVAEPVSNREKVVPYRKRSKKAFLLVALVAVLVFMFGTTGIGGRPFLLEMIGVEVGEKELTQVDSERNDDIVRQIGEEEKIEQEIKEIFNTEYVRMGYLPEDTLFLTGDIDKENKCVSILYQCGKDIIEYQIIFQYIENSYSYDVGDKLISEETMEVSGVPIEVSTYQLPDREIQYVAKIEYKDICYFLNAAISEEEFNKILNNLYFY